MTPTEAATHLARALNKQNLPGQNDEMDEAIVMAIDALRKPPCTSVKEARALEHFRRFGPRTPRPMTAEQIADELDDDIGPTRKKMK